MVYLSFLCNQEQTVHRSNNQVAEIADFIALDNFLCKLSIGVTTRLLFRLLMLLMITMSLSTIDIPIPEIEDYIAWDTYSFV